MSPIALLTGLLAALLVASRSLATEPPPARPGLWNTGTRAPADNRPVASGAATVRVFEGFGTAGPLYGPRGGDPAYAIDVSTEFGTCADGSRVITALYLAGARYELDARCPAGQSPVPAQGRPRPAAAASDQPASPVASPAAAREPAAIRCDARTWNCRSTP